MNAGTSGKNLPETGRPGPPATSRGPSSLAIAALVLALVGLIPCFLGLPAIIAIVFGTLELSRISRGESPRRGYGLALAGLIVGIISIVLFILWILLEIAVGVAFR